MLPSSKPLKPHIMNIHTTQELDSTGHKTELKRQIQTLITLPAQNGLTRSNEKSYRTTEKAKCIELTAQTRMHRLSPKPMPSQFTYQDNESDEIEVLSGEGRAIGYVAGEDGVLSLFNSNSPRRTVEYLPTQERFRQ